VTVRGMVNVGVRVEVGSEVLVGLFVGVLVVVAEGVMVRVKVDGGGVKVQVEVRVEVCELVGV